MIHLSRLRPDSFVGRLARWPLNLIAPGTHVAARAKIVLNPLRTQHSVDGSPDGMTMRTFEVPGCGGFLLASRSREAVAIFPEDVAGAYFADPQECIAQIERYLADPGRRATIAHAAHELVARAHRYVHRAAAILESCR